MIYAIIFYTHTKFIGYELSVKYTCFIILTVDFYLI